MSTVPRAHSTIKILQCPIWSRPRVTYHTSMTGPAWTAPRIRCATNYPFGTVVCRARAEINPPMRQQPICPVLLFISLRIA